MPEVNAYIEQGNRVLGALGFTEHSRGHAVKVAETAGNILEKLGYNQHTIELARIAGYMHDMGNCVNRVDHAHSSAIMAFQILRDLKAPDEDIAVIVSAIGQHDEATGMAGGIAMFEKFGELNSFGEINELAENLFNEGDTESLRAMAKENGIQSDFVDMYLQGEIPALCDQLTAALGKIDVEVAELKPKEIMEDWVEYLRGQCMENELLAFNVRKKGKSLKGCIAALLMWSFKNQQTVDKDIIKAAGVSAGKVTLGIPGMARAKQIITDYYMGK